MKHTGKANQAHRKAGDTIVEVVLVVAVIASVLGGAFLVARRSTIGVRDAEEHAQAVQYLRGQTELLRGAAAHHGGLPASLAIPFCLGGATYFQPAAGNSNCVMGTRYNVSIVLSPASAVGAGTAAFDLVASWEGLGGQTDRTYLSYRVAVAP